MAKTQNNKDKTSPEIPQSTKSKKTLSSKKPTPSFSRDPKPSEKKVSIKTASKESSFSIGNSSSGRPLAMGSTRKQNSSFDLDLDNTLSHTATLDSISSQFVGTSFSETMEAQFDYLDIYARRIISLLQTDVYELANLAKHEKYTLIRYFYRYNPILGRCVDLHTEIPLSKMRIQPPRNCSKLARDYMSYFYDSILERVKFSQELKIFVLNKILFSKSHMMIDDNFRDGDKLLQKDLTFDGIAAYSEEDKVFLKKIDVQYEKNPSLVSIEDKIKYLNIYFMGKFTLSYKGPTRVKHIPFYDIINYYENRDIDFEAIELNVKEGVKKFASYADWRKQLKDIGYSEGFCNLLEESDSNKDSILLDNDPFSGDPYLLIYSSWEDSSIMFRILEACLQWDVAKQALTAKIKNLGKVGRIVTSEELGDDQIAHLVNEVTNMLNDPGYAIVANYNIKWEEVNNYLKQEIDDLRTSGDTLKAEIINGLGIPDSLLSGESQFSGDNIKVEILNTTYFALKIALQDLLNTNFFKPIAIRKGFYLPNEWGDIEVAYPKVTFSLLNLRSAEYFEMLNSLHTKGKLPIEVIWDLLGIDPQAAENSMRANLWSLKSDRMNALVEALLSDAANSLAGDSNLADILLKELGLQKKLDALQEEQDLKSSGGGFSPSESEDFSFGEEPSSEAPTPETPSAEPAEVSPQIPEPEGF